MMFANQPATSLHAKRPALTRAVGAVSALIAAATLVACGGSGKDANLGYGKLVVFGDSLSDVGTYATPGLKAAFAGGAGRYTVNASTAANTPLWVDHVADRMGVSRPCAAQTGLESSGTLAGLAAATTNVPNCYGYAQGGARVTNPVGPANRALLQLGDTSGAVGQLTKPITDQVARHLAASSNTIAANDLVTVWAGANDLFMQLAIFNASVQGGGDPQTAGNAAVQGMATAGTELATLIRNELVARGAKRVVVMNVPDVSATPYGRSLGASAAPLLQNMAIAFNNQLVINLNGVLGVLLVDGYQISQAIAVSPQSYGFTNSTTPVCDQRAAIGSLSCSASTVPSTITDAASYQYADGVHPTLLAHRVFADQVTTRMRAAGWL